MSIPQFTIEPLIPADSDWVKQFTTTHWYADMIVIHGQEFAPHSLPGFVAMLDNERIGLVTYHVEDGDCEIITLNSLRDGMGVGTALIEAVKTVGQQGGCTRLWLVTTNDNLQALGFYEKRGFVLVALHRNAVAKSRQLKPSIPLIGENGIPIRDEIELEMVLGKNDNAA